MRRVVGMLCAGLGALTGLLAAAPASAAPVIGVSDQKPGFVSHPLFDWLGVRHVRMIAPWNAGHAPPAGLVQWLDDARARGLEAHVTFDCRAPCSQPPTESQMRAAFTAFRARWPHVTTFSTWNEANHPGQPTDNRIRATAQLYRAMTDVCPACRIVAVEVIDISGVQDWVREFRSELRAMGRDGALWGIHNYGDVTYNRSPSTTKWMVDNLPGDVWVTETGGIVQHKTANNPSLRTYDERRARDSVARALALADSLPRVQRMYVYQWRSEWWEAWDSGLLRPNGEPRPSFDVLAERLRPGVPVPAGGSPPAGRTPEGQAFGTGSVVTVGGGGRVAFLSTTGERLLTVLSRPRLVRGRYVRARVACPRERPAGCRVRMVVRTRRARLLGRVSRRVKPGRRATLVVRLSPADRRRVRRGALRRLMAEIAVPRGPRWRLGVTTRG